MACTIGQLQMRVSWVFMLLILRATSVDAAFFSSHSMNSRSRGMTTVHHGVKLNAVIDKSGIQTNKVENDLENRVYVKEKDISGTIDEGFSLHQNSSSLASYGFLAAVAMCFLPVVATAVDHPVDHFHLGIPAPVPDVRYFISGGLCAAVSHGVTTPIDVVKTRIQAEPQVFSKGLIDSTRTILEQDGIQALMGGLGPTIVGYGAEGAMKFGLYESLKPVFAGMFAVDSNPALPFLGASVVAGAVASLMLCPMERTRIRLVTDPGFASGLLTGLPRLIDEEGFLNIFSGMPAMLSKQVPYTITKQVSFDEIAEMLYNAAAKVHLAAADVKYEVSLGAAFLASILSCITSHPGDVVLTDTYKKTENAGFGEVVSQVYQSQGLSGFFTGLTARFFHVGAIITSQLVLYDVIKQLLGLPATGSH